MASKTVTVSTPAVSTIARLVFACAVIALIVSVAAKLPIYNQPQLGVLTTSPYADSTEAKEKWALRLDALADALPPEPMLETLQDMNEWAIEILPYMAYEGLTDTANVPADIGLFFNMNSSAFHLAGQALCRTVDEGAVLGPIILNGRYVNPKSAWYGKEQSLGVLVHELVHMQGGPFCSGKSEDLEANTQIAAMEVMAAMVNHGNRAVLRPLLLTLRDMVLSALEYDLSPEDYIAFYRTVEPDPFQVAKAEKALRHWLPDNAYELHDILWKYNVVPVNAIIEGLGDGTVERIGLLEWDFENSKAVVAPLKVDDLQYLFGHVDEYVAAR